MTSEDNLDGDDAITDEDGKSNSHAFSFDRLEKEEIVSEIPEEAKVSTFKECSQVANKDFEQMPSTEECSTESLNESQAAVANKDTEEFGKALESCPIPHDSPVKELEGASAVPPEDYKNEKKKDSGEETAAVNAGDNLFSVLLIYSWFCIISMLSSGLLTFVQLIGVGDLGLGCLWFPHARFILKSKIKKKRCLFH